jgi:sialic acid synthase SpsE
LGADIIEKHFTLDNHYSSFRDHQLSADPAEFAQLVGRSRGVRKLLGKAEKVVQPSEAAISNLLRRSIVAAKDLAKGHTVQLEDLMWTRPYVGLPPGCESQIVGKVLRRPIAFATPIQTSDIDA